MPVRREVLLARSCSTPGWFSSQAYTRKRSLQNQGPALAGQRPHSGNICRIARPMTARSFSAPPIMQQQTFAQKRTLLQNPVRRSWFMTEIFSLLLHGFLVLLVFWTLLKVFRMLPYLPYMLEIQAQQRRRHEMINRFEEEVDAVKAIVVETKDLMDDLILRGETFENYCVLRGDPRMVHRYNLKQDFSLKSAGASVINFSQSYSPGAETCRWDFCWDTPQPPDVILERDNTPGNCWAMKGSKGYVVIKLSQEIIPTFVALDHMSRKVSYAEGISSAPKDFSVYGLKGDPEEMEGTYFGTFSYDIDGYPTQAFNLLVENFVKFKSLQIRILSNWGHPNYTCIYGIRVNGIS